MKNSFGKIGSCLTREVLARFGTNCASCKVGTRFKGPQEMGTKKTIIVVDDNADMITVTKTILESKGYSVIPANKGEELFTRLEEKRPDLILLDIMMPQMDGLQILKQLKADSATSSIPVMFVTAKVQYQDVLAGYKQGANYYLTKPFTTTQLLNGINILLRDLKHG